MVRNKRGGTFSGRCLLLVGLLIGLSFGSRTVQAQRVYWEMGLAELVVGFDIDTNKTLVRQWNLAVIGPDVVARETLAAARACASASLQKAADSAYRNAGGIDGQLTAALQTWEVAGPACMNRKAATRGLARRFRLALTENFEHDNGLKLNGEKIREQAALYAALYERLTTSVRGAGTQRGRQRQGPADSQHDKPRGVSPVAEPGTPPVHYIALRKTRGTRVQFEPPRVFSTALPRISVPNREEAAQRLAELAAELHREVLNIPILSAAAIVMQVSRSAALQIHNALQPFDVPIAEWLPKLTEGAPITRLNDKLGSVGASIVAADQTTLVVSAGNRISIGSAASAPRNPSARVKKGECYEVCTPTVPAFCKMVCP